MCESERYKRALEFATKKHEKQFRFEGTPYISHPMAVAEILRKKGYNEDYQIAALFHDLLEDTDATEQEIEDIAGKEVLEAVKLVTKTKGYVMANYVEGIKGNEMAKAVKAADRLHNLSTSFVANDKFRRKYVKESIQWYMDFCPEIPKAVKDIADTLDPPMTEIDLDSIFKKYGL